MKTKRPKKWEVRYVVESETGWDIKRYRMSEPMSKECAEALAKYLSLRNEDTKHEVLECRIKRG